MMKNGNLSWPHPVLGNSNDIEGEFSVTITCKIENDIIRLHSEQIEISNAYFKQLLNDQEAVVIFKLTCNSTLFMMQVEGALDLDLKCSQVSKKINIDVVIVAKKDIENYFDNTFHDDTKLGVNKGVFKILSGTVIGTAGSISIPLNEEFRTGISGIIEFQEVPFDEPISIDVENPKILIKYPDDSTSQNIVTTFTRGKKQYVYVFFNLFLIPAFTEAFQYLIDSQKDGTYDEIVDKWDWSKFINDNLMDPIATSDNAYELSQIFLQDVFEKNTGNAEPVPIYKAFNEIFN